MRVLLMLWCVLWLSAVAFAQSTGTAGDRLAWDQPNATAAIAQTLTYRYYPDGATTGIVLTGVTCSGTAPVTCSAPFPAFTPGNHSLTATAANAAGESLRSTPFAFVFVVVPSAPVNLRVISGSGA